MTAYSLERALREHGLETHVAAISELALPSIRLHTAAPESSASRLGGLPRVAAGFDWPRRAGGPLAMMAQIALDELASAAAAPDWLPREGTLTFFYDLDDEPWGDAPEDWDSAHVLFEPAAIHELESATTPADLPPDLVLPAFGVGFDRETTLPSADADEIDVLDLTDEEMDAFHDLREMLAGGANPDVTPLHRMFGHPDEIQGSLDEGNELLLQLTSDEALGYELGDSGRLYFLVPREGSLAERLGGARARVETA